MPPLAAFSRRAVVAAALAAALAPGAEAGKRKRKKPPKPLPPLAFVAMTVTGVEQRPQGEEPGFTWTLAGALQHPDTGQTAAFPGEVDAPTTFTARQTRDRIIREAREGASFVLGLQGIAVPPDRVQVVLL